MKSSKMKKMKKRILAMLLCTTMMLNTGVSALADEVVSDAHVHTETCYEKHNTGNLICTKAEVAETEAHVHTDECYEVTSTQKLTCTQKETEGHSHGDGCVETTKVLDCDAEHAHDGGCYTTETNIVCGQKEVEAHAHGEGCYTTVENKTQICTLEEAEAHTHSDDCYEWEEKLICTIEETALAKQVKEEPVQKTSVEGTKEAEKKEPVEVNIQNADETGITVSIKSTSDVLAEDAKVVVAPMEADEEIETALAEAAGELDVLGYVAYDISLKNADDTDVSLGENKVDVAIDFAEAIPEGINAEEVKEVVLAHITADEEGNVAAETVGTVEVTEDKKATKAEFEAASFSPYVVTWLGEVAEEVVEEPVAEEPVVEDLVLTYTSEDEKYTVTATAKPEILENVAALEATLITEETKVEELTKKLSEKATEAQKTSLGFEAYEFKFFDAEGNEVTVNGEVKISFTYTEAMIPEEATAENVDAVDVALMETEQEVLEEINGLVSAEAGAVKEVLYTTEAPEELILAWSGDVYRALPNYEDDEVVITLAGTEYALQNVVGFNVTPIKEDNEETKEQYAEVAQQLEEKIAEDNEANEEEKEVLGFLAYDITLVDAEGNELEPQGNVRVSMEYKEAAAPGTVAEIPEAEVTIHHFEEDAKGEVKQIVDMVAEETIEATVEVTKAAEVEKVEFVTERFSIFTITWKSTENGTEEDRTVSGTVVTLTGTTFTITDRVIDLPTVDSDVIRISDINFAEIEKDGITYVFNKAVVCQGEYSSAGSIDVASINYYNGVYRANNNEQYVITNDNSGYNLYFVYLKSGTIATVDSKAENININVFDYSRYNKTYNHNVLFDINNNHPLKFATNGNEFWSPSYNVWTGSGGGPRQGMVNYNLSDGFPFLKKSGNEKEESLKYLFNNDNAKYDANHLFVKQGGYFVYDSAKNFAELDPVTKNFTVYDQVKYGFFPFNSFSDNISIQSAGQNTTTNHHFGMHVDFSFMQPHNGVTDGEEMIFEFSGDDDVWVFIDGMLVLDLGGIHQKTGGAINFATGVVAYDHSDTPNTTIRQMYINAYKELNYTDAQIEAELSKYFVGNTSVFKDYSQHKLDFFYLERGAHDSNCNLKFNLISIPQDSVTIEKEISNYADGAYNDVEFSFKLYLQNGEKDEVPGTPNNATDNADILMNVNDEQEAVSYEHITVDGTKTIKTLGADGVFKLKHKEKAIFSHLDVATKFYVIETGISQSTYDKVEIIGSGVLNESGQDIAAGQTSISTKTLEIGTDYYAKFQNRCAASNMKYLSIEKAFDEKSVLVDNPDFTFRVTLGGSLYTGKYKIGANYDEAVASTQEYTAINGIIKLKVGQVAVILGHAIAEDGTVGIPSETTFKVEEIDLDLQAYVPAKYEVTNADNIEEVNKNNGWALGKININKNAYVKVTNALRQAEDSPEIKVSKTFSGITEEQLNSIAQFFAITVVSKNIEPEISTTLRLTSEDVVKTTENGDITFTWTLVNYPAGTYTVKEENEIITDYDNVIKINGNVINSNIAQEITTTPAKIEYVSTARETSCSAREYSVGNVNLIVAQLTQNEGYFVWTRQRISVNERLAIVNLINDSIKFSPSAELNKCYFYSGDISDTLIFRDGEIRYDGNQTLAFDASSQWSMFATGSYTVVNGDSAEIAFENIYTPSTIDMDLKKISVNGSVLEGAEFILYKYDAESTTDPWSVEKLKIIATDVTGAALELTGLGPGRYKLVETKAPEGFFLLEDDIYFKVENRVAKLTNADGVEILNVQEMWELDSVGSSLTVKNNLLYELPSTGGHGIYTTMISGFALMLGAAYVWFMNRRKEML